MSSYLQISQLTKRFGAVRALDDVSLTIERGSVLALLGPNGAGKSTLFGCLLGLTSAASGEIRLSNEPINAVARARFGYLAERVALYPQRTVMENAIFFARLKRLPTFEVEQQLGRVGLGASRDRKVRQLSKGMLQRLGLAIALCGQPDLLVLDEPFNGLDPALLESLQIILREENQRGATLLISTHTMSAVEQLASHVAILLNGKLAAFSTLTALRSEHPEADSLEAIYHEIARRQAGVQSGCAPNATTQISAVSPEAKAVSSQLPRATSDTPNPVVNTQRQTPGSTLSGNVRLAVKPTCESVTTT